MSRRDATIATMGVSPELIPAFQEVDALIGRLEERKVPVDLALKAIARTVGGLIAASSRDRAEIEMVVLEFAKQMTVALKTMDDAGRIGCSREDANGTPEARHG